METTKLSAGDRRLLRMIKDERAADGWSVISRQVWPLMETLPDRLVELEPSNDKRRGGTARLSTEGHAVVSAMEWL